MSGLLAGFQDTVFLGWSAPIWMAVVGACIVAGVVRGFTGFGFPLIVVTATSLVIAPVEIVPIALLLDILAGETIEHSKTITLETRLVVRGST